MNISEIKAERVFQMLPNAYKRTHTGLIRNRWLVLPKKWRLRECSRESVNKESGEVTLVDFKYRQDADRFIKLFDMSFMLNLSRGALRLVWYIVEKMDFGGCVRLDRDEFTATTGASSTSMYKYMDELTAIGFMYKEKRCVYYVNPNYLSKGKRHVATYDDLKVATEVRVTLSSDIDRKMIEAMERSLEEQNPDKQ